jgi:predicted RNA-binding protein with PIN domain
MLYLIDGHNLIPFVKGLSLKQMDDEMRLLDLLQGFARDKRAQVEVFFDGAAPGWAGTRKYGSITAHFVLRGRTADDAIRRRLDQLPQGSGVAVVSADRQVQAEARSHRAEVVPSGIFAQNLTIQKADPPKKKKPSYIGLDDDEINEWLELFGDDPKS